MGLTNLPVVWDAHKTHWGSPWGGRFWVNWHKAPHVFQSELDVCCSYRLISASPSTGTLAPQTVQKDINRQQQQMKPLCPTHIIELLWQHTNNYQALTPTACEMVLLVMAVLQEPHISWWPPVAERARSSVWRLHSPQLRRWRCRNRANQTGKDSSLLALGVESHRL